jgi:hypothetical protein
MRTITSALVLSSALLAQSVPHTTTIPEIATGTYLGGASSFPLGRTGGRAQYWFRRDGLPLPAIVTAIGPRATRNAAGTGRTQSLEIQMSNTALPYAGFTKDFALNLGTGATIVHARKNISIPSLTAQTDPDQPMLWILLDTPFPLLGPNLVLDFDLGSAVAAASATYNGDLVTLTSPGRHYTSEVSCGGTLTATNTATSYDLLLSGATASQPTWLMISATTRSWGGQRLPYALDFLGMTGCVLGIDPQIVVAGVATGAGTASLSIPITLPATDPYVVYAQAAHLTTANPFGLATTNVTRSLLGSTGFCSYIYNFTVDGPLAQNGPNLWAAPMLLKP